MGGRIEVEEMTMQMKVTNKRILEELRRGYWDDRFYRVLTRQSFPGMPTVVTVVTASDELVGVYLHIETKVTKNHVYFEDFIAINSRLRPEYKPRVLLHEIIHHIASFLPGWLNTLINNIIDKPFGA